MKTTLRICSIMVVLFCLYAFLGCSNDSSSSDDSPIDNNQNIKTAQTVLYWDSSSNAFKGTVAYTAKTTETKVLVTGFIDSVTWHIEAPSGFDEWSYGRTDYDIGTYSVNPETYTVEARLQTDRDLFKVWSQIEGVKVTVKINFTTGSSLIIATQEGYGYTVDVSDFGSCGAREQFIFGWPEANPDRQKRYGDREIRLCYYGIDKAHKIKSATAYVYEDTELTKITGTYTAENDWTNLSWLQSFASSSSDNYTSFPTPYAFNTNSFDTYDLHGKIKIVITFIGGETYDTGILYY